MPYTLEELKKDSRFKGLPTSALKIFIAAFNSALKEYPDDETKCFQTAWAAVKKKFKKVGDKWAAFSIDLNERMDDILTAILEVYPNTKDSWTYIQRFYDDHIIIIINDDLFSINYMVDADGKITLGSEKTPVEKEINYVPIATMLTEEESSVMNEVETFITSRKDVSAADKKSAEKAYGSDIPYADEVNKKYPIDNEAHVRAAISYISMPRNSKKYSADELKTIKGKIRAAAKKFNIEINKDFSYDSEIQLSEFRDCCNELMETGLNLDEASKLALQEVSYKIDIEDVVEFTVEKTAKLFETGVYEDKDISVTEDDLDVIVANHINPIALKIEHIDSPFDGALGFVTKLWRQGKELLGSLSFTDPAWEIVEKTGIKSLSVGIKRDKTGLAEVSLVNNPRIADARVFKNDNIFCFSSNVDWVKSDIKEINTMPEITIEEAMATLRQLRPDSPDAKAIFDASTEIVNYTKANEDELKKIATQARAAINEIQKANASIIVEKFMREGKITPAVKEKVRAIILRKPLTGAPVSDTETVTFNDGEKDVNVHYADLLISIFEALPPVVSFQEIIRNQELEENNLTSEQRQVNKLLDIKDEDFKKFSRMNSGEVN